VLCQEAHKMASSCFKDVQCKNCSEKGHLRIDCSQDSSTAVEVENKPIRFKLDNLNRSKSNKDEKHEVKQESFDDDHNNSVEQQMSYSMKQESIEGVSTMKEAKYIVKGEYFEETVDTVKSEYKCDFNTSIVSNTKLKDSDNQNKETDSVQKKSEKRRRRKPKKRKFPGEPKKPMSAYFMWLIEEGRELVAQENPGCCVTERARSAGVRWKVLEETTKKKYEVLHKELRVKYDGEYKDWLEDGGKELIKQAKEDKKEAQVYILY